MGRHMAGYMHDTVNCTVLSLHVCMTFMQVLKKSQSEGRCPLTSPLSFKKLRLYARVLLPSLVWPTGWTSDESLWGPVQSELAMHALS